ncbi:MAG: hypothetical protein DRP75_01615 [Candidatus Omnitrophota bacterium]|nr:MAG: hypothetical protein DRP75_01615 [Candidatus Omnitrophota bacterium]
MQAQFTESKEVVNLEQEKDLFLLTKTEGGKGEEQRKEKGSFASFKTTDFAYLFFYAFIYPFKPTSLCSRKKKRDMGYSTRGFLYPL